MRVGAVEQRRANWAAAAGRVEEEESSGERQERRRRRRRIAASAVKRVFLAVRHGNKFTKPSLGVGGRRACPSSARSPGMPDAAFRLLLTSWPMAANRTKLRKAPRRRGNPSLGIHDASQHFLLGRPHLRLGSAAGRAASSRPLYPAQTAPSICRRSRCSHRCAPSGFQPGGSLNSPSEQRRAPKQEGFIAGRLPECPAYRPSQREWEGERCPDSGPTPSLLGTSAALIVI